MEKLLKVIPPQIQREPSSEANFSKFSSLPLPLQSRVIQSVFAL